MECLNQSSLEERIAYLTEKGALENISSHDKDSFYKKEGLPNPLLLKFDCWNPTS